MGLDLQYEHGQTPLDEEEKEGLKIKSITTQRELDEFEQLNIEKAVEWTIHASLKSEKIVTEKFIKTDKNIGIKWPLIELELKNLVDDTNYWIEHKTYSPEEIAIRFKHRIVAIHCFPNGNGRHSRMMADVIIEAIFKKEVFSWHKSNMVKPDETRKKYISALKEADNGNINPLLTFAQN